MLEVSWVSVTTTEKFMYQYAQVAKPLYKLVSRDNAKKKNSKIEWSPKCEEAFLKRKDISTNTLVLAYANYKKPLLVTLMLLSWD